jgi:hypothetical protein
MLGVAKKLFGGNEKRGGKKAMKAFGEDQKKGLEKLKELAKHETQFRSKLAETISYFEARNIQRGVGAENPDSRLARVLNAGVDPLRLTRVNIARAEAWAFEASKGKAVPPDPVPYMGDPLKVAKGTPLKEVHTRMVDALKKKKAEPDPHPNYPFAEPEDSLDEDPDWKVKNPHG